MGYRKYRLISLLLVSTALLQGCKDAIGIIVLSALILGPLTSEEDTNDLPDSYKNCPYPITTESHVKEVASHISKGIGSRIHGDFASQGIENGTYQEEIIECYPGTITLSGIISRSTQDCGEGCTYELYNSELVLSLDNCKTTYIYPDAYPLTVTGDFRLHEDITILRQDGPLTETSGGYTISDNGTEIIVKHQHYACEVVNKAIQDSISSLEITETRINTGNPIYATYGNPEHVTLTATQGEFSY